jgi:CDP-4-dehydro-6-deoxyglucose reductase, E3
LLLAGTGTGLAPLLGVLRSALAAGHRAQIRLFHGASRRDGLYLWEFLRKLQRAHPQLTLAGSTLEGGHGAEGDPFISSKPLEEQVLGLGDTTLAQQRVYLCGNPKIVRGLRREIYLAGVPFGRIHSDPFLEPAKV